MQRLVQRRADVAPHRVVAGQRLVGALEDDDVLLPGQRLDDGRFGERPEHVGVNRPDLRAARLAQVIDRRFDVFRGRSQRDEHRVGVLGLVLADQAVVAARQPAEVLPGRFEEMENRLDEVVAAGDDALHVVLLVLHRTEKHGIGQVDHARHAAALRAEQHALALGRTLDDVVGRAEVLANQLRLRACRTSARDAT